MARLRKRRIRLGATRLGGLAGPRIGAAPKVTPRSTRRAAQQAGAFAGAKRVGGMFGALDQVQPITPGSDVTRLGLDRLARAATQQRYGPAETQLQQQYAQSAGMEQKIPQWFDAYRREIQQLGIADAQARQYAQDQITGIGTTLANATVNAASADKAAMEKDAAIRGATIDPDAYTRAIQAGNVNVANLGNQAALQTQLGMNQGTYWRNQEAVSEQAKVQQLLAELAFRRQNIDPQAQELAREKGAFGQTFRQDFLNDESRRVLERKAFGLDKKKARDAAAADAASANAAASKYALDFAAKHGVTPEEYAAMSPRERAVNDRKFKKTSTPKKPPEQPSSIAKPPSNFTGSPADWNGMSRGQRNRWVEQHPTSSKKSTANDPFGNTPKQRRAANDSFTRATSLAATAREARQKGGRGSDGTVYKPHLMTEGEVYDYLLSENTNPVIARAAAQMIVRGYVDAQIARRLKRRGVTSGYTSKNPKRTAAGQHPRG